MPIQIWLKFSHFFLTSHLSLCMHTFSLSFSLYPPLLIQSVCLSLWLSLSLSDLFTVMTCIIFPFPLYLLICVIFPDFPLDLPSTAHLLNLSFSFFITPSPALSLSLPTWFILLFFLLPPLPFPHVLLFFSLSFFLSDLPSTDHLLNVSLSCITYLTLY